MNSSPADSSLRAALGITDTCHKMITTAGPGTYGEVRLVGYPSGVKSLHSRSWLAAKSDMADAVHDILGVRAGMAVTRPRRFPVEGAMSDAGWYLIVVDGCSHRFLQPPVLSKLSTHAEVVTCLVDERNLASAASGWRHGEPKWSVTYAGEDDPGNVVVEGTPPEPFAAIRDAQTDKSRADDARDLQLDPLFEIPIELIRQIVGYRPDEPSPAFDDGSFS